MVFLGAIIANLLLVGVIYISQRELREVITFENVEVLGLLFILIILIGIVITWISTFLAVNKFLRIDTRYLY